jgi:hypothetical protein
MSSTIRPIFGSDEMSTGGGGGVDGEGDFETVVARHLEDITGRLAQFLS